MLIRLQNFRVDKLTLVRLSNFLLTLLLFFSRADGFGAENKGRSGGSAELRAAGNPGLPFVTPGSNPDVRTLHFPADKSVGALMLMRRGSDNPDCWAYSLDKQIGVAVGSVTVTVPANRVLMLDVNRRIFENPTLLKQVSPYGIDAIKLSFISLADSEDVMFSKAIGYIDYIKGLKVLDLDRSEATDVDLAGLKKLPQLYALHLFCSSINGACFKDFALVPALYELNVSYCKLDQKNLVYLAQIPGLRNLDLGFDFIDEKGAQSVSRCTGLVQLAIGGNAKFGDNCLKYLLPLTKLRYLDLRATPITAKGLKILQPLKLKKLVVPDTLRPSLGELRALLPGTLILADGKHILTGEEKEMYSQLH